MARVYATVDQFQAYTGLPPDDSTVRLLTRASAMLDSQVLRVCWYTADSTTGLPTDSVVAQAFADATCAQVQWWLEVGDVTGAAGAGWDTVKIGTAQLTRLKTGLTGMDSPARQIAPQVWDALQDPVLTDPHARRFRLGAVTTW